MAPRAQHVPGFMHSQGDENETLDVFDTHPCHRPTLHVAKLKQHLCHSRPVHHAASRAEAECRQVHPSLLPGNGVRKAEAGPRHVRHG